MHPADSRGLAEHGWLRSRHSFSFAGYHDPQRIRFGALRVLNDDIVQGGMGFGEHPHDNMEIVSIPLAGELEHRDSMGNRARIRKGDVQVMSAGTGIVHSEFNASAVEPVEFLQIWMFPNKRNVPPRYGQVTLAPEQIQDRLAQILSPDPDDEGVWVHQDAWFHMGNLAKGRQRAHRLKRPGNGIYAFVLSGSLTIEGHALSDRDGLGITGMEEIGISVISESASLLLMEVPMN